MKIGRKLLNIPQKNRDIFIIFNKDVEPLKIL